jgi:7-cyano-7-deazaguanine synthase in queuosine biosynthesis
MERLYARSADEMTLAGDLGVWPIELRDYLTRLCLAYAPDADNPPRLRFADGLLLPNPPKPFRAHTCALLYSGGKDSMAAGTLAERAGYTVHALHVAKINHSYSKEKWYAALSATALGWTMTPFTPQHLPPTKGESVIKNQYAWAYALDRLDYLPEVVAFGAYSLDDCHTTAWYSDMRVAFDTFDVAWRAATGGQSRYLPLLEDELQAVRVWADLPDDARQATASCLLPARNKPQHRKRNLDAGVPLFPYDCGSCEKCYTRAVLLADRVGTELPYPPAYLARARDRLRKGFSQPLWCHADPRLHTPMALGAYPDSATWLTEHTFGGALHVAPRRNTLAAITPVILTT